MGIKTINNRFIVYLHQPPISDWGFGELAMNWGTAVAQSQWLYEWMACLRFFWIKNKPPFLYLLLATASCGLLIA
jgi:hypothetical protein